MKTCPQCQAQLPDDARFCHNCGPLQKAAPSVQAHVEDSGAIAQGDGAAAAGDRGVAISGDVRDSTIITDPEGNVHIGDIIYARTKVEELREALNVAVGTLGPNLWKRIRQAERVRPEQPYRYLDYFDLEHMTVFYGRDAARQTLTEKHIGAALPLGHLTVLYAPSGAGKTSLLQAGIVPDLYAAGDLPVYVRISHLREPVAAIKQAILPDAPYPDLLAGLPLRTFLTWTIQAEHFPPDAALVILLDQFEEFFIHPMKQRPFVAGLADCYKAHDLPVKFVLAIRKDYFADLDVFSDGLKQVYDNRFSLGPLSREEAGLAITTPLKDTGMAWEPDAVETLLDYLDRGEIDTSQLQLFCSKLYEAAKRAGQTTITMEGVDPRSIHADYLGAEMSVQPGFSTQQSELSWRVLKQLVTFEGTKKTLPLHELAVAVPEPWERLNPVLKRLVDRRLLRRDESHGEVLIEVAHDTLAAVIQTHKTGRERDEETARGLVERELTTWRYFERESKHLMSASELETLDGYREHLVNPDAEALEFLLRSALMTGHELGYWLERASSRGLLVFDIALEGLREHNFRYRATAVGVLSRFGERAVEPIIECLADDYPQVRVAAIRALERLRPDGAWREHLVFERYVPAGAFKMGSDHKYGRYGDLEMPSHSVELLAFYIGKYPVTNADYQRFVQDTGYVSPAHWTDDRYPEGRENHPVVHVSQHHAQDYAAWAEMRLPTEAEWEKAARGTDGRTYPWGDEFDAAKCNSQESGIEDTMPVGHYSPHGDSPYSCADMAGNVIEWTSTVWGIHSPEALVRAQKKPQFAYPYNPTDGRESINTSGRRVQRGGHFKDGKGSVRCPRRVGGWPDSRGRAYGFRVVMDPAAEPGDRNESRDKER